MRLFTVLFGISSLMACCGLPDFAARSITEEAPEAPVADAPADVPAEVPASPAHLVSFVGTDTTCTVALQSFPENTGRPIATLAHPCPATWSVAFPADGRKLVLFGSNTLDEIDFPTATVRALPLPPEAQATGAAGYNAQGELLLTTSLAATDLEGSLEFEGKYYPYTGKARDVVAWDLCRVWRWRDGGWEVLRTEVFGGGEGSTPTSSIIHRLNSNETNPITIRTSEAKNLGDPDDLVRAEAATLAALDQASPNNKESWLVSKTSPRWAGVGEWFNGYFLRAPLLFEQGERWVMAEGLTAGDYMTVEALAPWLLVGDAKKRSNIYDLRSGKLVFTVESLGFLWPAAAPLPTVAALPPPPSAEAIGTTTTVEAPPASPPPETPVAPPVAAPPPAAAPPPVVPAAPPPVEEPAKKKKKKNQD